MIRNGALAVLRDSPYESEDVLQTALADFPEALAGGTTSDDGDRRLLLIRREKGIPTAQAGLGDLQLGPPVRRPGRGSSRGRGQALTDTGSAVRWSARCSITPRTV